MIIYFLSQCQVESDRHSALWPLALVQYNWTDRPCLFHSKWRCLVLGLSSGFRHRTLINEWQNIKKIYYELFFLLFSFLLFTPHNYFFFRFSFLFLPIVFLTQLVLVLPSWLFIFFILCLGLILHLLYLILSVTKYHYTVSYVLIISPTAYN